MVTGRSPRLARAGACGATTVKREPLPTADLSSIGSASSVQRRSTDRKPKPKTRALIAFRFTDPIELAEDILALVFGDPRPGIPNLGLQLLAALAAGDNDASLRGCSAPHWTPD